MYKTECTHCKKIRSTKNSPTLRPVLGIAHVCKSCIKKAYDRLPSETKATLKKYGEIIKQAEIKPIKTEKKGKKKP